MLTVHELKGVAALCILLLTVASGMVPFFLQSHRGFLGERFISLGNSMTAGIFLCMGFSHILYEAGQDTKDLEGSWGSANLHFHIFMIAFLMVFGFESLLGGAAHDPSSHHVHEDAHEADDGIQLQEQILAPHHRDSHAAEAHQPEQLATDEKKTQSQTLCSFYMLLSALSFHSASTGLAMGVQSEYYSVIAILIGSLE